MICVGIDVAKDKHDCFILSSEGEVLADVFIKFCIPLSELPQTSSQTCTRLIPEITLQCACICIGHRHITRLHWNEFFVCFKVIIFRQHFCPNQFFLQNLYEIQKVLRILIANVVDCIRRNWQTIFSISAFRCALHDTNNTFHNIVHISKVTLAVAMEGSQSSAAHWIR